MADWSHLTDTQLICLSDRCSLDVGPPSTVPKRVCLSRAVCLYQHNKVKKSAEEQQSEGQQQAGWMKDHHLKSPDVFGDTTRYFRQGSFASPCPPLTFTRAFYPIIRIFRCAQRL